MVKRAADPSSPPPLPRRPGPLGRRLDRLARWQPARADRLCGDPGVGRDDERPVDARGCRRRRARRLLHGRAVHPAIVCSGRVLVARGGAAPGAGRVPGGRGDGGGHLPPRVPPPGDPGRGLPRAPLLGRAGGGGRGGRGGERARGRGRETGRGARAATPTPPPRLSSGLAAPAPPTRSSAPASTTPWATTSTRSPRPTCPT